MEKKSRLAELAYRMHELTPTANHDYEPAMDDEQQAGALKELFEAYAEASAEDKQAIEKGFFHLMDMQPYYLNTKLLKLVLENRHKFEFIEKTIDRLDTSTEFKRILKQK